jgi:lysophospholipase L1-like esterase
MGAFGRAASVSLILFLHAAAATGGMSWSSLPAPSGQAAPPVERFEDEIRKFEAADREAMPPRGGVLFVGSSSIRLWKTLATDFPGVPVINRGFGGSVIAESTRLAPRIIFPYAPRMIVFFAGTNDIASGRKASQVLEDYKTFVSTVKSKLPQARIAFIAITPAPSRRDKWPEMSKANRMVQEWTLTQPGLAFINPAPLFLDEKGEPRLDLYVSDQLHLSPKGYEIWRGVVGPYLPWDLRTRRS